MNIRSCVISCVALLALAPGPAHAQTVSFPLSIDPPLLERLVAQAAFTGPGNTAVVLDQDAGCRWVELTAPRFGPVPPESSSGGGNTLQAEVAVRLHVGTVVGGHCVLPLEWSGFVVLEERPSVDTGWRLALSVSKSEIFDPDRKPATVAGLVWNFVKEPIIGYLESIRVNLAPPVEDLKVFLLPLFPPEGQQGASRMIDSIRPGEAGISSGTLHVPVLADVNALLREEIPAREQPLTPEELERFVRAWQSWDSYLVYLLSSLAETPLSEEDRWLILDELLALRYAFVGEIAAVSSERDFVRMQFTEAWAVLSPIFRRHVVRRMSQTPGSGPDILSYLSFLTASDCLAALDTLGPSLGIEISDEGFARLVRMLGGDGQQALAYTGNLNAALRKTLGMGSGDMPSAALAGPRREAAGVYAKRENIPGNSVYAMLADLLFSRAWAADGPASLAGDEPDRWLAPAQGLSAFLQRVRELLNASADGVLRAPDFPGEHRDFFRRLVLATAWQESCYRQFVPGKEGPQFFKSYNGTSVGLMQINERVWRGIYDRDRLRWDIAYNAVTGSEILDLYFRRYALRKLPGLREGALADDGLLAGVTYAMYNGGPRELTRFLARWDKDATFKSDRLFREKYDWTRAKRWENITACLGGTF